MIRRRTEWLLAATLAAGCASNSVVSEVPKDGPKNRLEASERYPDPTRRLFLLVMNGGSLEQVQKAIAEGARINVPISEQDPTEFNYYAYSVGKQNFNEVASLSGADRFLISQIYREHRSDLLPTLASAGLNIKAMKAHGAAPRSSDLAEGRDRRDLSCWNSMTECLAMAKALTAIGYKFDRYDVASVAPKYDTGALRVELVDWVLRHAEPEERAYMTAFLADREKKSAQEWAAKNKKADAQMEEIRRKEAADSDQLRRSFMSPNSVGRRVCKSGTLKYESVSGTLGGVAMTEIIQEPGQLHANLEGTSPDGARIRVRNIGWATETQRLRGEFVSGQVLLDHLPTTAGQIQWDSYEGWFYCDR